MASIFPQARTNQTYWDNILRKIDCVTDVPASRWSVEDYYDPNPRTPDKTYCKRGGFIPDIDFDPVEFGLPPNILEATDVSQLLSLVVAKEALEDAGYPESREFNRDRTGVILGAVGISSKLFTPLMARLQYPVWEKALLSSGISPEDTKVIIEKMKLAYVGWEENSFPGTIVNVIAGRIANRFDLGATNCVVDAACGSSLAAVKYALAELTSRRADMMISGGVDADNSIGSYLCFSKTPAFSRNENVRTFDAEADGMMVGEGLGMLILKRLEDAEADGDRIYAVIRAIGSSSDGRFKSIYAPRPSGQAKALRRAYEEAGFGPETVRLIEAHGTGTPAGDPAEFEGLREVFTEGSFQPGTIALGSVKSQIAHTKAAAGAASLIKTALALHHKVLPPTINVSKPNPKLDLANSPFYISTETRPWIRAKSQPPRRAGVSSFGFGGTNFHVVMEEYQAEQASPYRINSVPHVIILHAGSPAALLDVSKQALQGLQSEKASLQFTALVEATWTGVVPSANARLGFAAENPQEAAELLKQAVDWLQDKPTIDSWEHPKGIYYRNKGFASEGQLVALFPGQGSQYVNMGRELAINFPVVRQVFAAADELFLQDQLTPLSNVVFPVPTFEPSAADAQTAAVTRTEYAQPAIGSFGVALFKLMQNAGFQPSFTAGHSFGELTALWAAGVLSDEDYLALAKARGKAMAPPPDPNFDAGTMLAVKGDVQKVPEILKSFPEVTLANFNSNQQVVLAGSKPAIAAVQKKLTEAGFSVVQLPVSAAFHTSLVGHAQKPFAQAIKEVTFHTPSIPVYSNTTGALYPEDPQAIRQILEGHILKPVLFRDEIEAIFSHGGRVFVEFGPKNVLSGLVKNILGERPHLTIAINPNSKKDSDRQYREAVVQLLVAGVRLSNPDPYALPLKKDQPKKKSPVTVTLNGGYYVTEKTRSAFEKALKDGHHGAVPKPEPAAVPAVAGVPSNGSNGRKPAQAVQAYSAPAVPQPDLTPPTPAAGPSTGVINPPYPAQPGSKSAMNPISTSQPASPVSGQQLDQFFNLTSDTLHLHEQYLKNQTEYSQIFSNLVQMGFGMFANPGAANPAQMEAMTRVLESMERSLSRFQDHQSETLRVHSQYLNQQSDFSKMYFQFLQAQPVQPAVPFIPSIPLQPAASPVTPPSNAVVNQASPAVQQSLPSFAPTPLVSSQPAQPAVDAAPLTEVEKPAVSTPASQPGITVETLTAALLEIVSEKTGYPGEMLDLNMDMEADLGIDSIKRVEILGAMRDRFPTLPKVEADALSEMRTLQKVTDYMALGISAAPAQAPLAQDPSCPVESTPMTESATAAAAPASGFDADHAAKALLQVVSEKTGYPEEMLDLNMDMEADLGIDSIKRVEILGAMRDQYPDMPKVNPDELSSLRTLGQILDHMGKTSPSNPVPADQAAPVQPAAAPESSLPLSQLRVKSLPEPDQLVQSIPAGSTVVLTDDGAGLVEPVSRNLIHRGWNVVVLKHSEENLPLPNEVRQVVLNGADDGQIKQIIENLGGQDASLAAFIHLHPPVKAANGAGTPEGGEALVEQVFLLAKYLKTPLHRAVENGRSAFLTVSRLDGTFGNSPNGASDPVATGLSGLVKSLDAEWGPVFCRAVDIHPDVQPVQAAQWILAELEDSNQVINEVGITPQGRVTLVLDPVH